MLKGIHTSQGAYTLISMIMTMMTMTILMMTTMKIYKFTCQMVYKQGVSDGLDDGHKHDNDNNENRHFDGDHDVW